jgi:hypothetical protein
VEDARVGDPMLQELHQPGLADFVEGSYHTLPISTTFHGQ